MQTRSSLVIICLTPGVILRKVVFFFPQSFPEQSLFRKPKLRRELIIRSVPGRQIRKGGVGGMRLTLRCQKQEEKVAAERPIHNPGVLRVPSVHPGAARGSEFHDLLCLTLSCLAPPPPSETSGGVLSKLLFQLIRELKLVCVYKMNKANTFSLQ
ncbi:hypothetical protein NPIL_431651 [Nephila pilipes]|uniref:Uncharacterized protein n=1 Tax=Nephila pilipes TaxID=299642 RepID=A0A8X6PWN8_NEPPI|nr:hypothetical protein NPIL_431651 [Nephila pilipes]